jgi:hypothetical protein
MILVHYTNLLPHNGMASVKLTFDSPSYDVERYVLVLRADLCELSCVWPLPIVKDILSVGIN